MFELRFEVIEVEVDLEGEEEEEEEAGVEVEADLGFLNENGVGFGVLGEEVAISKHSESKRRWMMQGNKCLFLFESLHFLSLSVPQPSLSRLETCRS